MRHTLPISFLNALFTLPSATASLAGQSISRGRNDGNKFTDRIEALDDLICKALHDFQPAFEVADNTQNAITDVFAAMLRLDLAGTARPLIDVFHPVMTTARNMPCSLGWYTNWEELRNKIEIYDLVQNVEERIDASPSIPISDLVDRAYALGDFRALWSIEGLGHYFAIKNLEATENPKGLLSDYKSIGLPRKCLTMMNAGMGLAFAEKMLSNFSGDVVDTIVDLELANFVQLCRANSTDGFVGCAMESLGLVARTFHKQHVGLIDTAIQRAGNLDLLGYFWHGAGRAHYFALENFVPCFGISWTELVRECKHEIGKHNLIAGLAWAINLVNMRTPNVMAKLLAERSSEIQLVGVQPFINGVVSSTVVRNEITPEALFVPGERQLAKLFSSFGIGYIRNSNFDTNSVRQCQLGELFKYPIPRNNSQNRS